MGATCRTHMATPTPSLNSCPRLILTFSRDFSRSPLLANCEAACGPPLEVNPVMKLWRKLSMSRHLCSLISEYFEVAEIGCCLLLGSVEDERCFSNLKFLKSCHRNRLGKHLSLVVRMFGQKFFSLENFPYREAINSWKAASKAGRQGDA